MTGKIAFKNPGTNFSYVPGHYQVIQDLISKPEVPVFKVRLHGMDGFANVRRWPLIGRMRPSLHLSLLHVGPTAMTIVHEATHAIQDWAEISAKNIYIETDAYIEVSSATLRKEEKEPRDDRTDSQPPERPRAGGRRQCERGRQGLDRRLRRRLSARSRTTTTTKRPTNTCSIRPGRPRARARRIGLTRSWLNSRRNPGLSNRDGDAA